jgi:outer membrane protein assembly factor BamB
LWFAARMGSLNSLIFAMENHWTLLLAVALSLVQTFSADWPEFRGPTGQGHASETRLPLHWSKTNNVAWKQAVPGLGWSSPVVVEGKVFLTTALAEGKENPSLRTLCLDARTGKILWNTEVFSPSETKSGSIHNKNSYASPTPLIHGGRIYVHYGHHGTACVDLKGKVLWRNNTLKYLSLIHI